MSCTIIMCFTIKLFLELFGLATVTSMKGTTDTGMQRVQVRDGMYTKTSSMSTC